MEANFQRGKYKSKHKKARKESTNMLSSMMKTVYKLEKVVNLKFMQNSSASTLINSKHLTIASKEQRGPAQKLQMLVVTYHKSLKRVSNLQTSKEISMVLKKERKWPLQL